MHRSAEILPYRELDRTPVPGAVWPLLLCVPPLVWLASTAAVLSCRVDREALAALAGLVMMPTPFCAIYALRTYLHERKTWYVVVCLALNAVVGAISGTPLLLLWAWAMIVAWT